MKIFRRNFLKELILSLSILPLVKFNLFFSYHKKRKLRQNKNFIWYLNDDD